ncbi:MAG TPA: nitrite reductase small subunit NirD [Ignavibacteria bacterium]|jgi:NAD(P)H-dependent nitrite reductase small subunit
MEDFQKICRITDLPNKRGRKFTVNDRDIAVFRVYEKVFAVINICPHNQSQVMYDGYIDENLYLACPIHGWQFHLRTGETPPECTDLAAKLETFDVKIVDDEVWVEVKKKKKKWML